MDLLTQDYPEQLIGTVKSPCISLYQPTHRTYPDSDQDRIHFKNLTKSIEKSLNQKYSSKEVNDLLKSFHKLEEDHDFWQHSSDGLAVFASPNCFKVYRLPETVKESAIVANSFHIKPLIRLMQSVDRYQVLDLNRERVKLYEGNRYSLEEIKLADEVPDTIVKALGSELTEPRLTVSAYGKGAEGPPMHHGHGGKKDDIELDTKRFFRKIDAAILKYHSKLAKLPLILAALPKYQHLFHQISKNPFLLTGGIQVHKEFSLNELREHAWQVMRPYYQSKLNELIQHFSEAKSNKRSSDLLVVIAKAAVAGKVETLLIDADRKTPGKLDYKYGTVQLDDLLDPEVDDLLDDLGEIVIKKQGQVFVLPKEEMPTQTGIAAVFRY